MKFSDFIKSKILNIVMWVLTIVINTAVLNVHDLPKYSIFYVDVIISALFFVPLICEFVQKYNFYNSIKDNCENLDKKFLLSEMLDKPDFYEGELFYDILKACNKSMNDEIAKYRIMTTDYMEYIEKWVHEIKTPIAACKLAAENHNENTWEELMDELDKIDSYVDQTLFYSRVTNAENDYIIRKKTLNEIVSSALKANSRLLIKNGFSVKRENLDFMVMTDEKWTNFILEQIISNSVKYKTSKPVIIFSGEKKSNGVVLNIIDNGIGISDADLPRIFEKNFTGGNGRLNRKSTGFGLYLCKKLCNKMGIDIYARSENGTIISILFPKNSTTDI